MIIYNLINYIAYSSNKAYSNIKKLRNLVRILHFYCMFLHSYDINKISSSIKNLEKQLTIPLQIKFNKNAEEIINKYPIFVYSDDSGEKNELFKSYMKPIQEYLLKTINNYLGFAESVQTKCYMSLNQNKLEIKDPKYIRFIDIDNEIVKKIIFEKLEELTLNSDINRYVLHYTSTLYKSINSYLNLIHNNLESKGFSKFDNRIKEKIVSLSNSKEVKIMSSLIILDTVETVKKAVEEIDNVFKKFETEKNSLQLTDDEFTKFGLKSSGKNVFNYINDTFTVYSFQLIYNYSNHNGVYQNINSLKSGDIFIYPQYISTTWLNTTKMDEFADPCKTLLRITINKNNPNWIFLNNYSSVNSEHEILIKRGSTFIVKNNDTTTINVRENNMDINIIDLELLDDTDGANFIMNKILSTSGTNSYYDNPTY